MIDAWIKVFEVGFMAVGAVAPSIVAALTGGQTAEEAIAAARAARAKIPDRTDQADADLTQRLERG
jgi:hypothetical protein